MAGKLLSMLQIRRIIQLSENGFSGRFIAKQCGISRNTVRQYLDLVTATSLPAAELLAMNDEDLKTVLHDPVHKEPTDRYFELLTELASVKDELGKTGVTKELLWQEYKLRHPQGYSYSQFCYYLNQYLQQFETVMNFVTIPAHTDPPCTGRY